MHAWRVAAFCLSYARFKCFVFFEVLCICNQSYAIERTTKTDSFNQGGILSTHVHPVRRVCTKPSPTDLHPSVCYINLFSFLCFECSLAHP